MSDELEMVDVKIHITAGDDFETLMRFPTVKGSERVYWAAASYGAAWGVAEASSVLVDIIPEAMTDPATEVLRASGRVMDRVRNG